MKLSLSDKLDTFSATFRLLQATKDRLSISTYCLTSFKIMLILPETPLVAANRVTKFSESCNSFPNFEYDFSI